MTISIFRKLYFLNYTKFLTTRQSVQSSNKAISLEHVEAKNLSNFVSLPLKFDNPYYHTVNINDIDSHLLQAAHQYKGQAQDMFSRTFQIQIYQYFLPNIVWFVCLDFLKCSNLRKIALYWPIKKNALFYLWEILVKKFVD